VFGFLETLSVSDIVCILIAGRCAIPDTVRQQQLLQIALLLRDCW